MMNRVRVFSIIGILVLFAIFVSLFTINAGTSGLLFRLGVFVENNEGAPRVYKPGLHIKFPFIDVLQRYDMRLQTFDVPASRVLTKEQKAVDVDYYIKWRISDLALFYQRTNGQFAVTQRLMKQKVNDAVRAEFGEHTITEVISGERSNIMATLKDKVDNSVKSLGIEVVDVRIKRIDLPKDVSISVFERMRADREKVANKHRSEGRSSAEALQAAADAQVTVILAKAKADAAEIRAKGDAKAAQVYNNAYQKNDSFFKLLKSLDAYQNSFKKGDFIVIKPDTQYFDYYKNMSGIHKSVGR